MHKYDSFIRVIPLAAFLLLLTALPALATDVQTPATAQAPQADLIGKLEAAKKADWNAALDPTISPVRQETFLNQMNKADRAIREINHGFPVSQSKMNDALWMPPEHITPVERANLIQKLKQAREQDDRNEQHMLNDLAWTDSREPANTEIFDQRKAQVDSVVKNLEIGAPVHWTDIEQALVVVSSAY